MRIRTFVLLCAIMLCLAQAGMAQETSARHGIGPVGGISFNPDQIVVGGQAIFGLHGSPVHFGPLVDIGFGDNITTFSLNFDASYDFVLHSSSLVPYAGAGLTWAHYSYDSNYGSASGSEVGLSLIGGTKIPVGAKNFLNLSARLGVGDIPDAKIMVGYIFGMSSM